MTLDTTYHHPAMCERHAPVLTREDFAAANAEQDRRGREAAKARRSNLIDKVTDAEVALAHDDNASPHDLSDADMLAEMIVDAAGRIATRFMRERILHQFRDGRPTILQVTDAITVGIIESGLDEWFSPAGERLIRARVDLMLEDAG